MYCNNAIRQGDIEISLPLSIREITEENNVIKLRKDVRGGKTLFGGFLPKLNIREIKGRLSSYPCTSVGFRTVPNGLAGHLGVLKFGFTNEHDDGISIVAFLHGEDTSIISSDEEYMYHIQTLLKKLFYEILYDTNISVM